MPFELVDCLWPSSVQRQDPKKPPFHHPPQLVIRRAFFIYCPHRAAEQGARSGQAPPVGCVCVCVLGFASRRDALRACVCGARRRGVLEAAAEWVPPPARAPRPSTALLIHATPHRSVRGEVMPARVRVRGCGR